MGKKTQVKLKKQSIAGLGQSEKIDNHDSTIIEHSGKTVESNVTVFIDSANTQSDILKVSPIKSSNIDEYTKRVASNLIEKYEVDLYRICETFYDAVEGRLNLRDLLTTYPLFNARVSAAETSPEAKKYEFLEALSGDFLLPIRHKLILNVCELISALFVKWGIFNRQKYEFRYTIRCKSLRIFDVNKIRSQCFNTETLWFSLVVNAGLLPEITTTELKQYSHLLEEQTNTVFELLLKNHFVCIPSIEDAVGIRSKEFRKKCMDREPLRYLGVNEYFQLRKPNFISGIVYKKKYQEICKLVMSMEELELIYRKFEKELVGRFLLLL